LRRVETRRLIAVAVVLFVIALIERCSSKPAPGDAALTPIVSVKELMENVVDPTAEVIFDAVVTDITAAGVVETRPTTEEDWLKVQRAALLLAETTNLLKMPRQVAPPGDQDTPGGELSPAQIQAKVDADRARFSKYADDLRDVAIKWMIAAKAKNVDGIFQIGGDLDTACENCHLEYWYPGDKKNVQK
jgi:cytochrome c556